MRATFLSESLQKRLPFINHAVSSKPPLAILQNFLLEAKKGKIYLSATDLEIGIELIVNASIEEEGTVTIPAKPFTEFISSLPAEKITIWLEGSMLRVEGKHVEAKFQTSAAEEFPTLYEEKGEEKLRLTIGQLKKYLTPVVFAVSLDNNRPDLSSVLFTISKEKQQFVATDGYRLSLTSLSTKNEDIEEEEQYLISGRLLRELVTARTDDEEVVIYASVRNSQIVCQSSEMTIVGRLIEGNFPNYQRIIPNSRTTRAFFDKEDLQKAVRMASIFARESANIIKLTCTKEDIIISANTPSIGENTVHVEARIDGDEVTVAFNAKYLIDFLSNTEGKEGIFETSGALNPGVFKIEGNQNFFHIIMPIRVQAEV